MCVSNYQHSVQCVCVSVSMYTCECRCSVVQRGHKIPRSWSYRQLCSCSIWVLGTKPGCSSRASGAPHQLNHGPHYTTTAHSFLSLQPLATPFYGCVCRMDPMSGSMSFWDCVVNCMKGKRLTLAFTQEWT